MLMTYAPDNRDEPVWMMKEIIDRAERTWWRVRLWTGEVLDFDTREQAAAAYWR